MAIGHVERAEPALEFAEGQGLQGRGALLCPRHGSCGSSSRRNSAERPARRRGSLLSILDRLLLSVEDRLHNLVLLDHIQRSYMQSPELPLEHRRGLLQQLGALPYSPELRRPEGSLELVHQSVAEPVRLLAEELQGDGPINRRMAFALCLCQGLLCEAEVLPDVREHTAQHACILTRPIEPEAAGQGPQERQELQCVLALLVPVPKPALPTAHEVRHGAGDIPRDPLPAERRHAVEHKLQQPPRWVFESLPRNTTRAVGIPLSPKFALERAGKQLRIDG
mmetsp:Transcript_6560/g.13559  ORF Transcript_6560/g.13559 Transcript_6560/m.13559 type:complete len:280 (-) Transcript_6560:718-1557(-)